MSKSKNKNQNQNNNTNPSNIKGKIEVKDTRERQDGPGGN